MRELCSEVIADRRVALIEHGDDRYMVTIAVRGPQRDWEDISLTADQDLAFDAASRRYRRHVAEQLARRYGWR